MKLGLKAQKLRDRMIYEYSIVPTRIDVGRHVVTVGIRSEDVPRLDKPVSKVEEELQGWVDRKVEIVVE